MVSADVCLMLYGLLLCAVDSVVVSGLFCFCVCSSVVCLCAVCDLLCDGVWFVVFVKCVCVFAGVECVCVVCLCFCLRVVE